MKDNPSFEEEIVLHSPLYRFPGTYKSDPNVKVRNASYFPYEERPLHGCLCKQSVNFEWRLVKRCGPAEVLVFYGSPAFLLSWNFIVKVTFVSLAMGQSFLVLFWIVLVINSHHVANHRYDAFISQNGKHDYTLP